MSHRAAAVILASCLLWLAPAAVFANGLVVGRVRLPDGSPVEGAKISGENVQNGRTTDGTSDRGGRFAFIGLSRGQWIFRVEKYGYEPSQGIAMVTRGGRTTVGFTLEVNPFAPPVPETGVLAGIQAVEIQNEVNAAHALFDRGEYDGAIEAYETILERVPKLTSLNLQIGYAYLEKRDHEQALAAYRAVPADTQAAEEAASAISALSTPTTSGR